MNKKHLKMLAKFIVLTVIMAVLWIFSMAIGVGIFGVDASAQGASENTALLLFLAAAVNTGVIYTLITKSKWYGWKLVGGMAVVIFGIQFFMAQMEALYFNESLGMPTNLIYSVVFAGIVLALSFSMIAVKMLGKWKKETEAGDEKISINADIIIKLIVLTAIVYPVLYFGAGYFIAWQLPELRILYSGSDKILPFFQHYQQNFQADPFLYPFQIFRGFLWIGIAMVIMRLLSTGWKMKAFLVGITFALIMNSQHLIPNPYMPGRVPLYHFIETASSNFIWGYMIVWLLEGRKKVVK